MSKLFFCLTFVSLLLFSGCSMKKDYNRDFISTELVQSIQKNQAEKVIILTDSEIDKLYVKYSPTTSNLDTPLGQAMSTLTLPIGQITREVTYEFYSQYFDKVERSNNQAIIKEEFKDIILKPKITSFNYAVPLTNMGLTMTPNIHFVLNLEVYKNNKMIMSKSYDSGTIYGETSMGSSLYDDTNKALHKGLFNLYKIVNQDIIIAITNNQ